MRCRLLHPTSYGLLPPFPHDVLGRVATRIINEANGINSEVYNVTSKPPGTIECEQRYSGS